MDESVDAPGFALCVFLLRDDFGTAAIRGLGESVALTAGHDLTVTGSGPTGTGSAPGTGAVDLMAGGAMTFQAAAVSATASSSSRHDGGGFGRKSHGTS